MSKVSCEKRIDNPALKDAPLKGQSNIQIRYSIQPYNWLKVLLSPEVILALSCMGVSTYLLVEYPSYFPTAALINLSQTKSDYSLRDREHEKQVAVPTFIPTDLVLSLVGCLSTCFFMSACCRVILKKEKKLSFQQLEESLRRHYDPSIMNEWKAVQEKEMKEENAKRIKEKLYPLKPSVVLPRIAGEDVSLNLILLLSFLYTGILVVCVLYRDLNETRAFGISAMFSTLIAGIVLPKMYDDVLTLMHFTGLLQNILIGCILYLCFSAVLTERK